MTLATLLLPNMLKMSSADLLVNPMVHRHRKPHLDGRGAVYSTCPYTDHRITDIYEMIRSLSE
jgi:hypothetical protein